MSRWDLLSILSLVAGIVLALSVPRAEPWTSIFQFSYNVFLWAAPLFIGLLVWGVVILGRESPRDTIIALIVIIAAFYAFLDGLPWAMETLWGDTGRMIYVLGLGIVLVAWMATVGYFWWDVHPEHRKRAPDYVIALSACKSLLKKGLIEGDDQNCTITDAGRELYERESDHLRDREAYPNVWTSAKSMLASH